MVFTKGYGLEEKIENPAHAKWGEGHRKGLTSTMTPVSAPRLAIWRHIWVVPGSHADVHTTGKLLHHPSHATLFCKNSYNEVE